MGKGIMMRSKKIRILMRMAMMGGRWREVDNEERMMKRSVTEDQRKARVMMENDKKEILIDRSK